MLDFGIVNSGGAGNNGIEMSQAQVDKQTFLNLLVTQLKSQDPFDPIENEDFLAQLAQFSSLESLNNIYGEMSTSNLLQNSTHNALSTSLLNNYAVTVGGTMSVSGENVSGSMFIMPDSGAVKIEIFDSEGNLVRTIDRENLDTGEQLVDWDGKNADGDRVNGVYTVDVTYTSGPQAGKKANIFTVGKIRAVRFYGGSPVIVVDEAEYNLSDLIEVMSDLPGEKD
jgi:flagellar basal-body rod modification protein FlgD